MKKITMLLTTLGLIGLQGCGGGSSTSVAKQGVFVDSAVSGLAYTCGAFSGLTSGSGEFSYESGSTCTFKVGGIVIGSAAASAVLTPVSLVSGAVDETDPTVVKIAQWLQSLDEDSNLSNGIGISSAAHAALANASLDWSSSNFSANASSLLHMAYPARSLVDAASAQNHMQLTLLGLLAGSYACSFSGGDSGNVTITVANGQANGQATGQGSGQVAGAFNLTGSVSSSGQTVLASGSASSGANFSGTFTQDGHGSGQWENGSAYHGQWTCVKS